jgi:hypothetical protein
MVTIQDIQRILAYQGLAAAQAAAAGTTDTPILQLLQHYRLSNCSPTTAPIPATSGPRSVSPDSYWYYNPGGQDICSFSLWDPLYGVNPTPPDPDPTMLVFTPVSQQITPTPIVNAPPPSTAMPVISSGGPTPALTAPVPSSPTAGIQAWLMGSSIISNVPNWMLIAGAAAALLFFGQRR